MKTIERINYMNAHNLRVTEKLLASINSHKSSMRPNFSVKASFRPSKKITGYYRCSVAIECYSTSIVSFIVIINEDSKPVIEVLKMLMTQVKSLSAKNKHEDS